jgi:hypothetical protein
LLIGAPSTCRSPRSIPTLSMNLAPPPLPYLLPLSLAPPLMIFFWFKSQQIEPLAITRRAHVSSHTSTSTKDASDCAVVTIRFLTSRRTSSSTYSPRDTTGASPEHATCTPSPANLAGTLDLPGEHLLCLITAVGIPI